MNINAKEGYKAPPNPQNNYIILETELSPTLWCYNDQKEWTHLICLQIIQRIKNIYLRLRLRFLIFYRSHCLFYNRFRWKYPLWDTLNSKSGFFMSIALASKLLNLFWKKKKHYTIMYILSQHICARNSFENLSKSTPILFDGSFSIKRRLDRCQNRSWAPLHGLV